MPRKPIIRSNEHYYHLTGRSNGKEHFYLTIEKVWPIMVIKLRALQVEHDLKIAAFVLMDNHFHLLALTPKERIDRIMYFFMKRVTGELQKKAGRTNKIFGGRYKGCLIENSRYLLNAYKYIYRNPIAAGISERAEEYQFSTFNERTKHPLELDQIMPANLSVSRQAEVQWINSSFDDKEAESMRWGLTRSKFQYKRLKRKVIIQPEIKFNYA